MRGRDTASRASVPVRGPRRRRDRAEGHTVIPQNGPIVNADRPAPSRIRRWLALVASVAVALGAVVGATTPAAAADDPVPGVRGSLLGERVLPPTGGTLVERVLYENLTPGLDYGMDVRLLNLDGTETGIEVMENFRPLGNDGSVDVELEVAGGFFGGSRVAVVGLCLAADPSAPVAVDFDLGNPLQTVVISRITIEAALIAERWTAADGWIVTERITYQNLTPGGDYVAYALFLFPDGSGADAWDITRFVPTEPNGTVTVDVALPPALAGRTIVATAGVLYPPPRGDAAAVVDDLTDPLQTMTVRPPLWVRASVADKLDGDRILAVSGGDLIDTVSFDQLEPGGEYTVTGTLVRQSDGTATPVTASTTFTATTTSGSVQLTYVVPVGYAGAALVSVPQLFNGTDTSVAPLAVDDELDDPTQTVTVTATRPLPATGTGIQQTLVPLGAGAMMLVFGIGLLVIRRRVHEPS